MTNQRARAHANRAYFCTCGAIVHGNGGKAGHAWMHENAPQGRGLGDGHHYVNRERYHQIWPDHYGGPSTRRNFSAWFESEREVAADVRRHGYSLLDLGVPEERE